MPDIWSLVDALPPLNSDDVQLWRIDCDATLGQTDYYFSFLNAEEQTHANNIRAGQVRDHFTIGRACLRILLGNALGIKSGAVSITKGANGKPETPAVSAHNISFNIAHSKGTLLIALRRKGAVGVDVEYLDRATDIMEVAQGNFTENEFDTLASISDPEIRLRTFYRYWTRKEAIVKADGRGLLLSPASFDVSFNSMERQPIRVNEPSPSQEGTLYIVSDLDLGNRAVGALALESPESHINRLIFPPPSTRLI